MQAMKILGLLIVAVAAVCAASRPVQSGEHVAAVNVEVAPGFRRFDDRIEFDSKAENRSSEAICIFDRRVSELTIYTASENLRVFSNFESDEGLSGEQGDPLMPDRLILLQPGEVYHFLGVVTLELGGNEYEYHVEDDDFTYLRTVDPHEELRAQAAVLYGPCSKDKRVDENLRSAWTYAGSMDRIVFSLR